MHQSAIHRWGIQGAALVAALLLTAALAGNITGTMAGSGAGSSVDGVTRAATDAPQVELTAGFDILNMWRDVLRRPAAGASPNPPAGPTDSSAAAIVAPPAPAAAAPAPDIPDGLHSIIRIVLPQLLPDNVSGGGKYLITEAADFLLTPLSNMVARSRLGLFISPLVAFGNSASAFVGHVSGDQPDPIDAMLDLVRMPGLVLDGYYNGASLNLAPLASMFTHAGMLPADSKIDFSSLRVGLGGRYNSAWANTPSPFPPGVGTATQILRDVTTGFVRSPFFSPAG